MPREVEVGQAVGQAVCRRRGGGGPGGLPGQVEVEGGLLAKAMPRSAVAPAQTLELLILPNLEVGQAVVEQEGGTVVVVIGDLYRHTFGNNVGRRTGVVP